MSYLLIWRWWGQYDVFIYRKGVFACNNKKTWSVSLMCYWIYSSGQVYQISALMISHNYACMECSIYAVWVKHFSLSLSLSHCYCPVSQAPQFATSLIPISLFGCYNAHWCPYLIRYIICFSIGDFVRVIQYNYDMKWQLANLPVRKHWNQIKWFTYLIPCPHEWLITPLTYMYVRDFLTVQHYLMMMWEC